MNYIISKLIYLAITLFLSLQVHGSLIEIELVANADSANYESYYSPSTLTNPFPSTIYLAFNSDSRRDTNASWGASSRFNNLIANSPMSDLMNVANYDEYDPLNSAFDIRQGYPLWQFPNPQGLDESDNPIMSFISWFASRNISSSSYYSHNIYLHGPLISAAKDSIFESNALDYLLDVNKYNLTFDFSVDRYLWSGGRKTTGGYVRGIAMISDIRVDGASVIAVSEPKAIWLFLLALVLLIMSPYISIKRV